MPDWFHWKPIYPRHEWTAILKRRAKKKAAKDHQKKIAIALATKKNKLARAKKS